MAISQNTMYWTRPNPAPIKWVWLASWFEYIPEDDVTFQPVRTPVIRKLRLYREKKEGAKFPVSDRIKYVDPVGNETPRLSWNS